MPAPVANFAGRRWQADFLGNRTWFGNVAGDAAAGSLSVARSTGAVVTDAAGDVSFVFGNALRRTDRGALIELAGTQRLSNSAFAGAVVGGVAPDGWTATSGMTVTPVAINDIGDGAQAEIVVDCVYTNSTGSGVTVRVALESSGGVLIGALPRQFVFSGMAAVVSSTNAGPVTVRLVGRDSGGAAVGDQGAVAVASASTPQPFAIAPAIDAAAVRVEPAFSWAVAAGTTSTVRLVLRAMQLETGTVPSSWIRSASGTFSREPDRYVNPRLVGGVPGTPGTLPQFWSQNTMSSYRVIAAAPGFIDIELTNDNTAGGSAVSRSILLSAPTGGLPSQITAEPGQRWVTGVECTVVSDTGSSNARLNISARDAAGATIGGTVSGTFASGVTERREVILTSTGSGTTAIVMAIITTAPAGTISTVRLQLRDPRAQLQLPTPGVVGERAADLVQHRTPSLFAGASTVMLEVELDTVIDNATLLAITTGSGHTLRVVAGSQIGVVVSKAGDADVTALAPLYAAPGITRVALSYQAGGVRIGVGDPAEGLALTATVASFDPATVSIVWIGSNNGANPAKLHLRRIEIDAGVQVAARLPARTRGRWSPRTFVQPRPSLAAPALSSVPAYAPPAQSVTGASHTYSVIGNSFWRRSHGSAMTDTLPAANSVGAVEGTPAKIQVINDGPGNLTITSISPIRPPYSNPDAPAAAVTSVVLPPGFRILFAADGYNPSLKDWQAANEAWWYVIRPVSGLSTSYEFVSIYGPPDPANPNRSIIFPPAYCAYNSDIGPLRQLSGAAVQAMNRWIFFGRQAEASAALRYLRDACATDYWRESIGITTITALKSQINSTGYAYLGCREAGAGTAADHAVIRQWFRYRMDQTVTFFEAQIGAGRISPGVWASTSTGRGNHAQQAGLAAAVCACILDHAGYLDFAWRVFRDAVQDAADVPSFVGALPVEMRRAQKSLQYQCLAMGALVPLAEILERFGYGAYSYLGGALITMINWTVEAIDDPDLVTAEQTRMIGLGAPWSTQVVSVTQEPIGLGQDTDPTSGELLPNESRVAWIYQAYRRLTTAQASWRPTWATRFNVYDTIYAGGIGGAQSYLYRWPGITLPVPE
ncbi:MAG: alginate lyase family protein [Gammaproteobacteria bacterium]|nr:alginate lyase family protein [Gammaproteobacteria bacterium]